MLISSCYGNYTIQTIIENWSGRDYEPITSLIYNQMHWLSLQKYSSNVVEKCLEIGGEGLVTMFINEICQKTKLMGKICLIRINEELLR